MAFTPLDRNYEEAYALLVETRNYMRHVLPSLRAHLGVEERLKITYQSTRLTTRLLEMMAWLMAQKAVQNGEMTWKEARMRGFTITPSEVTRSCDSESCASLPDSFRSILQRSDALYQRLTRLDDMVARKAA